MIIDGVIVLSLLMFALVGIKRGFLLSLLATFGFVASVYLSYLFFPSVSNMLNKMFNLSDWVSSLLGEVYLFKTVISSGSFFWIAIRALFRLSDATVYNAVGVLMVNVLSFAACFIVSKICIKLLKQFVQMFSDKSFVLGKLDKIAGLMLGIVKGILFSLVVCSGIYSVGFTDFGKRLGLEEQIYESQLIDVFNTDINRIIESFNLFDN